MDINFTAPVTVSVEKCAAWFRWISIAVKMQWSLLGCASCCSTLWTGLIKPLWEQKIVRHYLQEESVGTGRAIIIGSEVPLDSSRQESRQFTCTMGWKSYLNTQSGYFSVLLAHLSAWQTSLETCYGKGYFLFLPCFILFLLLVFYLRMLNVRVSHLMGKTKLTPDKRCHNVTALPAFE